ncbi:MAG: hypothetical protein Q9168_002356 [Polycauliona sp. 1 TL-2023]
MYRQDRGPMLLAVVWVFAFLTLATVATRIWTRCKILHRSGPEDWLLLFAWVLLIIYSALLTASVHLGLGKHPYAIDPSNISRALKLYTLAVPFGILVLALPTLAVAIVLRDLIAPTKRHTWILYLFPLVQIIISAVGIIVTFETCKPTSTLWSPQPNSTCFHRNRILGVSYFISVYNASVDIFLAAVPLAAFWKLQIKRKAKVVLGLVMSATVLAAICALVRLAYVPSLVDVQDYPYASILHTVWSVIECNVIIIAACIPGLRPFVKYVRSRFAKKRQPTPLYLHPKTSLHDLSMASTALPSPLSLRRMEPRSSGSVSGSLPGRPPKVYRQNSLARIESTAWAPDEATIEWQPGYREGEKNMGTHKHGEEKEEARGRPGGLEAGEAIEVDGRDLGTDEDSERDSQVQDLREILDENRVEYRQSWLDKMRARVDKRMTI